MRLSLLLPVLSSSRLVMLKLAIFDKTGFWGLKYPPEVRVEQKTCSTICGTPAPAILIDKNSTGLAGGARKGQNMARKCPKMNGHTLRPWFPADNLQRGPKTGVMGKKLLDKLPCYMYQQSYRSSFHSVVVAVVVAINSVPPPRSSMLTNRRDIVLLCILIVN